MHGYLFRVGTSNGLPLNPKIVMSVPDGKDFRLNPTLGNWFKSIAGCSIQRVSNAQIFTKIAARNPNKKSLLNRNKSVVAHVSGTELPSFSALPQQRMMISNENYSQFNNKVAIPIFTPAAFELSIANSQPLIIDLT